MSSPCLRRSSEQRVDLAEHVGCDRGLVAIGPDKDPTLRLGGCEAQIALANALVEGGIEHLEAVPLALRAPSRPSEPDVDGDVEEERPVGNEVAAGEGGHGADLVERHAVPVALIRRRRIEEAVGNDDLPRFERRTDVFADVLRARGRIQEHLRLGAECDLLRMEDDLADPLACGGPAGLAREDDLAATLDERIVEGLRLDRLARSFPALERQEDASHRYICTRRTGSWPVERDDRLARSASSCCSRRTYAFCGASSTSSVLPCVTASIASRASSSAWSSGPRRMSITLASALAIWLKELLRAM